MVIVNDSHHGGFFGLTGIMVSGVRILYILRKVKGVSLFHYVVIDSTKHSYFFKKIQRNYDEVTVYIFKFYLKPQSCLSTTGLC